MLTDPISDMFARIKNAYAASKPKVVVPVSNYKLTVAQCLERHGYLEKVTKEGNNLVITLKYQGKTPAIAGLKRISKPGLRVYEGNSKLPRVLGELGLSIVSTSQGILSNKEARQAKMGGEIVAYVW